MKNQPVIESCRKFRFRNSPETLRYFYHPDHIGSTSWVTDSAKNGIQYCEYLPFGEPFIDQRSTTWNSRYTFSGKERDGETGYSYFGARYYNSDISIWLSVDPMADKYPNLTPYAYCANNPVNLIDPDGNTPRLPDPKRAIANAITSSAEMAHKLYQKASNLISTSPRLTGYANSLVSSASQKIASKTDMNPNTMGWGDLANIWLYELGNFQNNTIQFGQNAATTKDLQGQAGVSQARQMALDQIASGDITGVNYTWVYGQNEFYAGLSEGNVATSFLGSYNTKISIVNTGEGQYSLNYTVSNTSGWESGTRLRKDNDGNGQHDAIIPDKVRGEGIRLGGNLRQTWTWTETILIE